MPCIASLIVFSILFDDFSKNKKKLNVLNLILLFILLINFTIKFSFVLSSFILGLILFYENFKLNNLKKFIILSVCLSFYILLPYFLFRIINFGTDFKYLFLSPLPLNIFGYDKYHELMTVKNGNWNLLNFIIPESLGKISTIFGPSALLIFFLNFKKFSFKEIIYFSSLLFFLVIQFYFGSGLNRFYYEPYIWIIYLVSMVGFSFKRLYQILLKYLYLQSFILFIGCIYLVTQLFPGSLSNQAFQKVMHENAKDYSLIKWANLHLDKNDKILSYSRSTFFFNTYSIYEDLSWYVDFTNKDSQIYLDFLKSKKINRLVYGGVDLSLGVFKNCIGNQIAFEEKIGSKVGRNPFNRGEAYNGWIYEFNYKNLPGCVIR